MLEILGKKINPCRSVQAAAAWPPPGACERAGTGPAPGSVLLNPVNFKDTEKTAFPGETRSAESLQRARGGCESMGPP